jgi:tetratricopeptide (TPR) repeat protein
MAVSEYLNGLEAIWKHPSMACWRADLGNPTDHDLSLAATFAVSWERVEDEAARRLFVLAGYCAPNQPIPCAALERAAGLQREACDGALGILTGLGLLEMEDAAKGPVIHPLLAEYARHLPEAADVLPALAHALAREARAANDRMDQSGSPLHFVPLLPHVRLVAEVAETGGLEDAANLWGNLDYYLSRVADYSGAREASERALAIDERVYGPDHPEVATSVNNLGSVLRDLGDLAGARVAFERALAIDERAYGPDHPNVARDVNNLGGVLRALGDLAGARAAFERALAVREMVYGRGHPDAATTLWWLGTLERDAHNTLKAREYLREALAIFEKFLPPDHPTIQRVRGNLEAL